jgi:hypothetical protein
MTVAAANDVIMAARAHWFEGEEGGDAPTDGGNPGDDAGEVEGI